MSEPDINAALQNLQDAWNRGDAAAYANLFTQDAQYIAFNGQRVTDRASIESTHRWLFNGPLAGSRLGGGEAPMPAEIRLLSSDVALVTVRGSMSLPEQDLPDPGHESIITLVAVRDHDEKCWRFASFQNTRRVG